MKSATLLICVLVAAPAAAEPAAPTGTVCAGLLEMRRQAESQGRLDFSVVVEATGDAPIEMTPLVQMGSPYGVGRIIFSGHTAINDSTLRRALTLREREVFDVGKLRESLSRLNEIAVTEPLTLADVRVTRNADGVTADVTIPLRERRRRWWSLAGPIIPGLGSYQATIAYRLSTYYVSFNLLGLARPLLGVLPLLSKSAPVLVALERPYLPGQGLLSGFALSPMLSPRATLAQYGRTQLSRAVTMALDDEISDTLVVPIARSGHESGELLVCQPAKPRLQWLRRGVMYATDLALAALWP
ncbi:MAG TPA: POTRA domain-containing protein [Vicinamibacterales bacterium]|nr:POTRA domain-containing protein [Vicinamibacterales bacterium]